jgi:hypothetical protein
VADVDAVVVGELTRLLEGGELAAQSLHQASGAPRAATAARWFAGRAQNSRADESLELGLELRRQGSGVLESGIVARGAREIAAQLLQGREQLRMGAQTRRLDSCELGSVGDGDGGTLLNSQRGETRLECGSGGEAVERQR